jgi:lipopolysaccharide transport system ATP-binding protein
VERYIDTPVKRYSSGMTVRLGFAVAAFLEPEILVVDEVLAVGDAEFQKKAIGKMQNISHGDGRTVLFVSHNMGSMQQMCTKGLLLENGSMTFRGNIGDTIATYLSDQSKQSIFINGEGDRSYLYLESAKVSSSDGNIFYNSSEIYIDFEVTIGKKINSLVIGFNLISSFQHPLARADYNDREFVNYLNPGRYMFKFKIPPFTLSNGEYKIKFDISERNVKNIATDHSNLFFNVVHDEKCFGNRFSENINIKSSIIREDWLVNYVKL